MYQEMKKRKWFRNFFETTEVVDKLSDIIEAPDVDFKVGDRVSYINDYGIRFDGYRIVAISKENDLWKYGNCIYLDKDAYWYPVKPENLVKVENHER